MTYPQFILASVSPKRSSLFARFKIPYKCLPPDFNEVQDHIFPYIIPLINAEGKCRSTSRIHPDSWVISADTVIESQGRIIGKPLCPEDAEEMLLKFSGRTHRVITAIAIARDSSKIFCSFADHSQVSFRKLSRDDVREYISKINPLNKAGAYSIDEYGEMIIEKVTGSKTNVAGLPIEKLTEALLSLGIQVQLP